MRVTDNFVEYQLIRLKKVELKKNFGKLTFYLSFVIKDKKLK